MFLIDSNEFLKVGIFFIVTVIIALLIISLSLRVGAGTPDTEKLSAYECGFDPYEDARNHFDVRFYLVAMLFIVFDLEAIFFFPWCASFSYLSPEGFFSMIDFTIELLIGYIYAWMVGALEWS